MKHLCYGTFSKVLLLCSLASQIELHKSLLAPIVGDYHSLLDEGRASKLFNSKAVIPKKDRTDLKNKSAAKLTEITTALADTMSRQIRDSMLPSAVAAICAIICGDKKIPDDVVMDQIQNITKGDLKQGREFNAIDFLSGAFIFTFINTDNMINKEATDEIEITMGFIEQAYEDYKKGILQSQGNVVETPQDFYNASDISPNKLTSSSKYFEKIVFSTNTYQRLTNEINDLIDDIGEMPHGNPRIQRKREQLSMLQHELEEFEQAVLKTAVQILESPMRTELHIRAYELITYGKCEGAEDVIAEIERSALPLLLAVGVHNGEDAFVRRINSKPGDEVLVQMSFKNISGLRLDAVAGRVVLPDALAFVKGSAKIYNKTNPNGLCLLDGITEAWVNLGGYGDYDGKGRGSGSVSFRAIVKENLDFFVPGVNTLNIVCQVGGYAKESPPADYSVAYTSVDITIARK